MAPETMIKGSRRYYSNRLLSLSSLMEAEAVKTNTKVASKGKGAAEMRLSSLCTCDPTMVTVTDAAKAAHGLASWLTGL